MWRKGITSSLHAENQASPVPTHAQERPGKAQECSQEVRGHQHRDKDEPRRERALLRWEEGLLFRHSYTASYPTVAYRDLAQAMHHKITMIIISLLGPCRRGETDYSTVSQPLTVYSLSIVSPSHTPHTLLSDQRRGQAWKKYYFKYVNTSDTRKITADYWQLKKKHLFAVIFSTILFSCFIEPRNSTGFAGAFSSFTGI